MSRSLISKISFRGRIAVLVSACALAAAGAMALIGSATSNAAPSDGVSGCSNATLRGAYTNSGISWSGAGSSLAPTSYADFTWFDGNDNGPGGTGTGGGVATVVATDSSGNSSIPFGDFSSDSATYKINSNCTGTVTTEIGPVTSTSDIFVSPDGSTFTEVQTAVNGSPAGAGAFAVTNRRVSRTP